MKIDSFTFYGPAKGPALLVFGAIHGNEICGAIAITRMMQDIVAGKIKLQKGDVTFVPIANPLAYEKNVRFVKENLNRIFRPIKRPRTLEARFANELCDLVNGCNILLDIHSTSAPGRPFIYLDFPTAKNRALAKKLGPAFAVSGWPELYKKLGKKHRSYETTSYAAAKGKDTLLIECGQHRAKTAPTVAYKAILHTLRHYGFVKGKAPAKKLNEIRMSAGFFRENAKDRLANKHWRQFDHVRKGNPLIRRANGTIFHAPYDAIIIMPKPDATVGQDWLYLGR